MDATVWIGSWQQQCCGEDFRVGSTVRWQVTTTEGGHPWLAMLLGPEAEPVGFREDHHTDEADGTLTGVVSGIEVVTCERVLGDAPSPGPGGKAWLPVPGSGRRRRVEAIDLWEPEPAAEITGWSFDGWIVALRDAMYEVGIPDAVSDDDSVVWLDDDETEFLSQLRYKIDEEASLFEVPGQVTDVLRDGPVVHGPWDPADCSAVLLRWLERGWIELYAPDIPAAWNPPPAVWSDRLIERDGFHVLTPEDARQLLLDPARWTFGTADGYACLTRSDAGTSVDFDRWLQGGRS